MKNASIFSTAFLLLSVLFVSQTAQAQWSQTTTTIYPTTLTKKVGIGMSNPSYQLHVTGKAGVKATSLTNLTTGGVVEVQSTDNNFYLNLDGNKLQATKTNAQFMYTANALLLNPFGGSVGVGTSAPAEAKFVVEGAVGNTAALFRKNATSRGLSMVTDWPGLYFNCYYNGGGKAMAAGYAGIVNFDPDFGRFDFGITGTAATASNASVDVTARMSINKDGNVSIGGPSNAKLGVTSNLKTNLDNTMSWYNPALGPNLSHVHFGLKGDWYIRSAANDGVVVMQDNAGGVGIGTANVAGFKLAVNGTIRAKEIRVQTGWADYVFADDYQLRPLEEVETFIKANTHLPDIQPAKEIQENGLDVAATTTKMMAKIEELTLYLIDLKK